MVSARRCTSIIHVSINSITSSLFCQGIFAAALHRFVFLQVQFQSMEMIGIGHTCSKFFEHSGFGLLHWLRIQFTNVQCFCIGVVQRQRQIEGCSMQNIRLQFIFFRLSVNQQIITVFDHGNQCLTVLI
mgnify:CR=1 FL=1